MVWPGGLPRPHHVDARALRALHLLQHTGGHPVRSASAGCAICARFRGWSCLLPATLLPPLRNPTRLPATQLGQDAKPQLRRPRASVPYSRGGGVMQRRAQGGRLKGEIWAGLRRAAPSPLSPRCRQAGRQAGGGGAAIWGGGVGGPSALSPHGLLEACQPPAAPHHRTRR